MSKWEAALRFTGIGFFIGVSITLGILAGLWIDRKLGTQLFWIIGLVLGLIVAFYGVFRMLLPLMNDQKNKENK